MISYLPLQMLISKNLYLIFEQANNLSKKRGEHQCFFSMENLETNM